MAETGAWAAHCPTSNSSLGSGLFPLRRHIEHGVGVALGSDVGAGTGLFMPKEAVNLSNAADPADALARVFALATAADVVGVWARGDRLMPAAGAQPVEIGQELSSGAALTGFGPAELPALGAPP